MYTRSCCVGFRDGINIFRVGSIHHGLWESAICAVCKTDMPQGLYAARAANEGGAPLAWLKRIPPLSELESEKDRTPEEFEQRLQKAISSLKAI